MVERYADSVVEQVSKHCESVSFEDVEKIREITTNVMTQLKADIVDALGNDIASGVTDRVNLSLDKLRSA